MLTNQLFTKFLTHVKSSNNIINWTHVHGELSNDKFFNEHYFATNINKIKGSIFEHIVKYILLYEGNTDVYLFSEIPINLRKKYLMSNKDRGIDIIYYDKKKINILAFNVNGEQNNQTRLIKI